MDVDNIQQSIAGIDLEFLFQGTAGSRKVEIFGESLNNTFHNYIPNKVIKCDYKELPCVSEVIKSKLNEPSKLARAFFKMVRQ